MINNADSVMVLEMLIERLRSAESEYACLGLIFPEPAVSSRFELIRSERLLEDPEKLRCGIRTGCFSLESVPFSVATFLRHPKDFRAGVLEAVNAGGDTDTTGSMVGGMIGANCGIEGIPAEWRDFRQEFRDIQALGEAFWKSVRAKHGLTD